MNINEYQDKALSTRLDSATGNYAILGLAGEVGEYYSLLAKAIRDNEGIADTNAIAKELGDILWFVAVIAKDCGFTLEDVAAKNLEKLNKRKEENQIQGSGDDR